MSTRSKLDPQLIEDIVHLRTPAPAGYRYLTPERQAKNLEAVIARLRGAVDPTKVVEAELLATDAKGQTKTDKDGFPVSRTVKRYARDLVAQDEIKLLAQVRDQWRAQLQFSQAEHQRRHDDEQYEIEREFGKPETHAGKRQDIQEFVRDYRARRAERDRAEAAA